MKITIELNDTHPIFSTEKDFQSAIHAAVDQAVAAYEPESSEVSIPLLDTDNRRFGWVTF